MLTRDIAASASGLGAGLALVFAFTAPAGAATIYEQDFAGGFAGWSLTDVASDPNNSLWTIQSAGDLLEGGDFASDETPGQVGSGFNVWEDVGLVSSGAAGNTALNLATEVGTSSGMYAAYTIDGSESTFSARIGWKAFNADPASSEYYAFDPTAVILFGFWNVIPTTPGTAPTYTLLEFTGAQPGTRDLSISSTTNGLLGFAQSHAGQALVLGVEVLNGQGGALWFGVDHLEITSDDGTIVPEPASLALAGAGAAALAALRRLRRA